MKMDVSKLPSLSMEAGFHNSDQDLPITSAKKVIKSIIEGIVIGVSS